MPRPDPIVIAHRGACGYLPEHSLAAKAMAHAMGADFLEQDVVLTSDGVPIVLHDIYLDCTTDVARKFPGRERPDGRFYAIDFTLAEVRQLRLHERSDPSAQGDETAVYPNRFPLGTGIFTLPTLEEEIALINGLDHSRRRSTGLYVEFKAPNWHRREGMDIVAAVLAVLAESGYLSRPGQVFLQCFDGATLRRLREEFHTPLPLIQLIGENDWGEDSSDDFEHLRSAAGLADIARYADGIGPWLAHIYQGRDSAGKPVISGLASQARSLDLQVHPYTFRRDELPAGIDNLQQLLEIFIDQVGIDGLFTDFPDEARRYLDNRGGSH